MFFCPVERGLCLPLSPPVALAGEPLVGTAAAHTCCLPTPQHGKTKLSFLGRGKLLPINPRPLSGEENIINTNVSSPFYASYINHPTRAHGFPSSSLRLPCNYWEESCFVYKKLHFAKHCNRTQFRDSLTHPLRGERTQRSHVWDWEEAC